MIFQSVELMERISKAKSARVIHQPIIGSESSELVLAIQPTRIQQCLVERSGIA